MSGHTEQKKRVLLTGGTGFIGRNIIPHLEKACILYAPTRAELNLLDADAVTKYIQNHHIEVVIHAANPNPAKNSADRLCNMCEESIRSYLNLCQALDSYEMLYTLGSGAEYDKTQDIVSVPESEEFRSIPQDSYGFAKYVINKMVSRDEKQCNLRVFGCYGPTDHSSKFITHAIRCCLEHQDITIRQDCYFDYIQVSDLGKIIEYFIYHKPRYRSYNVCSGIRVALSEIADKVRREMRSDSRIVILKEGWNKEYTASNARLSEETGYSFMTLEEGIRIQIESELKEKRI